MSGESSARFDAEVKSGLSATVEGTCVGYVFASRLVLIDVGGVAIPMPWLGPAPWKGDRVRILKLGETRVCQSVYGSAIGTVVSVAANVALVTGDDGVSYRYPVRIGDTISAGHRVRLDHAGQLVAGRYAAEPPSSDYTTPPAPPAGTGGTQTFLPTASGSYRSGAYRGPDVEVNVSRTGVYWYGTQIADTIPDGATITAATISLSQLYDQIGVASLLGTHAQASPGGEPVIAGVVSVNSGGTFSIMAVADALKTGAALGVGFQKNTGYRAFGSYAFSGAITISWQ